VAVWCICLLYAMVRLAQEPSRLAQCLSPTLRYCSLFVGLAILSATYSADPLLSVFWGFKLVVFLAVLIAFFDATDPVQSAARFWNATHCALILMLVQFAVFALISPESALDTEDSSGLVRLGGYLFPPTQFSAACGMALTLSLIAFIAGRHRALHIALCILSGILMLASAGRGGMLATVVSATMVCLWYRRYRLALAGIAASCIVFAAAPSIMAAFADVVTRRQDWDQISTLTGRLYIWEYALSLVRERPFFGWGFVAGGKIALVLPTGWWRTPGDAHNALLEVLLALGFTGLLVLGLIIIRTITSLLVIYSRHAVGLTHTAHVASVSVFMSVLVQGLFEAAYGGVPRLATGIFLGSVICLQALSAIPTQDHQTHLTTRHQ
jgi:O-antigen ligase